MKKIITLIVENSDLNSRIDSFISGKENLLSRTRVKNLILKKKLKLNNKTIIDPSYKVSSGQKINFYKYHFV